MKITLANLYGIGGATKGKLCLEGRNGACGTGYEELTPVGAAVDQYSLFAGTAAAVDLTSSSADDDTGGTGAITVSVMGLDSAYNPVEEIVTLNGQTAVSTTQEFLRVHAIVVLTAGTGLVNAGDIYAVKTGASTWTAGVPDDLTKCACKVPAGMGQSKCGTITVPALQRYKPKRLRAGGRGDSFTLALFSRDLSVAAASQVLLREWELDSFTTGPIDLDLSGLPAFGTLTDLTLKAKAASGTALVSAVLEMERGQP